MAGANNAQMKAAGYRARDITKQRAEHGRLSHTVMEASGSTLKKGHERPAAAPRTSPPSGWQAAARGEGGDARRAQNAQRAAGEREKVLGAYRAKSADLNRAGDEGQRALRQGIRDQVKRTREAERQAWGERVVGPRNGYMPASEIRAAQVVKAERTKLAQMLQSRDAVARGRKQAATPGQGDLFGTPAPQRGASPFQQRVAARREMLAAAGERAKGRLPATQALSRGMLANRKGAVAAGKREDRAALLAARLQNRATSMPGTTRGDIAMGRLQQLVQKYPGAGRLGAQIRAEQQLESRQAVKRIMRTTMGASADRRSAGLPAQRSPRMEGLLQRASAQGARQQETRKRVKGTLSGKVARVVAERGQSRAPGRAKASSPKPSQDERAALLAGRLLARGNRGMGTSERSGRAMKRANAILGKYPQARATAHAVGDELSFRAATKKGYPGTRRDWNARPQTSQVRQLLKRLGT